MVRPTTDQVAVHDARLVNKRASTNLEVEFTFAHGGHAPALYTSGISRYLHAVTHTGDRLVRLKKVPCDTDQVRVVAYIFRGTASGEKNAQILLWIHISKGNVGFDGVTLELASDFAVPVRSNLVQDHMVTPLLRPGHHRLKIIFLQTVIRIQCVYSLGRIADYNQYLIHRLVTFSFFISQNLTCPQHRFSRPA